MYLVMKFELKLVLNCVMPLMLERRSLFLTLVFEEKCFTVDKNVFLWSFSHNPLQKHVFVGDTASSSCSKSSRKDVNSDWLIHGMSEAFWGMCEFTKEKQRESKGR